jgi:hypothetical protein
MDPAGNETMAAGKMGRNFTNETDAAMSMNTADSGEPNDKVKDKTKEGMAKQSKSTTLHRHSHTRSKIGIIKTMSVLVDKNMVQV